MIVQKKENAVSPAIATVLLVLMTVLIAAVIAVVVTGMAGDQTNYVVGLTADPAQSGGNVTVTLYGGKDLPNLVKAEVTDAGSAKGEFVEVWKGAAGTALTGVPLVAESVARPEEDRAEYATRIMTKGTFADGTEQVLLERAVTFRNVRMTFDRENTDLLIIFKDNTTEDSKSYLEKLKSDPDFRLENVLVEGLLNGDKLSSITLTAGSTERKTTRITPSDAEIVNDEGKPVSYPKIEYIPGNLKESTVDVFDYIEIPKFTVEETQVQIWPGWWVKDGRKLTAEVTTKNQDGYSVTISVLHYVKIDFGIFGRKFEWEVASSENSECDGRTLTVFNWDRLETNGWKVVIDINKNDAKEKIATITYLLDSEGKIQ